MKANDAVAWVCPACGVEQAAHEALLEERRRTGQGVFCINGHPATIAPPGAEKKAEGIFSQWLNRERGKV